MLYVCVGRRELGKTTLALHLTRNVRPRVVFDPRALCPSPRGRITTYAELTAAFDDLSDDGDRGIANAFDVVVTPDHDPPALFGQLCAECKTWLSNGRPLALVVDESTFVDLVRTESFQWIIRQAPRRSAYVVLTQHRPYDVPIQIRAIVDVWCVFRTTETRDLDVIAERTTDDFAAKVSKLKPREFMSWDDSKTDSNIGTHLDPTAWHVPLVDGNGVTIQTPTRVELPRSQVAPAKTVDLFTEVE